MKKSHEDDNPLKLQLLGIVFILSEAKFLGRYNKNRYYTQVQKRIKQDFTMDKMFTSDIPMDVNVAKAVDLFMPVVLTAPKSSGSEAFCKLTQEVLDKVDQITDN